MKLFARSVLSAAVGIGMAFSAAAGTYVYQDEQYKVDINGDVVKTSYCKMKDGDVIANSCKESQASVAALVKKLETRVEEAEEMLNSSDALVEKAKKLAADEETVEISDPSTNRTYLLLELAQGLVLPIDKEEVDAGDFSIVKGAIQANHDRYSRVLKMLESGDVPADMETEYYGDVSGIIEMENIVKYADSI